MTKLAQQQHVIDLLRYDRVITIRCSQSEIDDYWQNHNDSQDATSVEDRDYYTDQAENAINRIYYAIHTKLQLYNLSITIIDEWFEMIVVDQVPQIIIDDRILIKVEYD